MQQPIKKEFINSDMEIKQENFYTLLVDGHSLLKICMVADKKNDNNLQIGAILQFLLQLKIMLSKRNFKFCYVFWDNDLSGILRYNFYSDYKKNRDKAYSEYDKALRKLGKYLIQNRQKNEREIAKEQEKMQFENVRAILIQMLEELFIRQVSDENGTESDDLIAYYCQNKLPNEKIYLISRDNDLTQLINDDICVYQPTDKLFLHKGNFQQIKGIPIENVILKKILCGDVSDNIKGIKGLGEGTLYKLFPDIMIKPVTLNYIIETANAINEERKNSKPKQKPLLVCENIINRVTDGIQGEEIYKINKKIISLKEPLLTDNIKEDMNNIIHSPLDPEGRSMENLYRIIVDNKIQDLMGNKFSSFFSTFKKLIDNEIEFYRNNI